MNRLKTFAEHSWAAATKAKVSYSIAHDNCRYIITIYFIASYINI